MKCFFLRNRINVLFVGLFILLVMLVIGIWCHRIEYRQEILSKRVFNMEHSNTSIQYRHDIKFAHFSLDDVIDVFFDLNENSDKYISIFENKTLSYLKYLHETYGVVFSLYCFYENNKINLGEVTNKYSNEFISNSNWLKFGYHSLNEKIRTPEDVDKNIFMYQKTIEELVRITGSRDCIDRIPRLHLYAGSKKEILKIKKSKNGIIGLLTADDYRKSYYLNDLANKYLDINDLFVDKENKLIFFHTDFRIENLNNIDEELSNLKMKNNSSILIFFTHEWLLNNKDVQKNMEICLKFLVDNNYLFEFPMNIEVEELYEN